MFTISSQTFYDSFLQHYRNIYVVDRKPDGAFGKITRQVAAPKLSPFKTNENDYCRSRCIYPIYNPNNPNELLCIDEIALLFSYLTSNGYLIDTSLTKMMQNSKVNFKNNFVCFVRKID